MDPRSSYPPLKLSLSDETKSCTDPALLSHILVRLATAEFFQICRAVAVGFALMGFIGYFVKLIHIPINNILVCVFSPFYPLSVFGLLRRDDVCGLG